MSLCHVVPELSHIDPEASPATGGSLRPGSAHYKIFRAVQLAFVRMRELGEFDLPEATAGKAQKSKQSLQNARRNTAKSTSVSEPLKIDLPKAFDPTTGEIIKPPKVIVHAPDELRTVRALSGFNFHSLESEIIQATRPGEEASRGRSPAFFVYSEFGAYLMKEMKKSEIPLFYRTVRSYVEYLRTHPHSLLIRFLCVL